MSKPMLGEKDNPFIKAPDDWDANGLPYGAWCRCKVCGYLGRSTISFDYYRVFNGDGAWLICETCQLGTPQAVDKALQQANILPPKPDEPSCRATDPGQLAKEKRIAELLHDIPFCATFQEEQELRKELCDLQGVTGDVH